MNHWLGIALVAYLIGAAIEGFSTASQLINAAPELAEDTQAETSEPTTPPHPSWRIIAAIASVSVCGALCWPCRLIHRSIKENMSSKE